MRRTSIPSRSWYEPPSEPDYRSYISPYEDGPSEIIFEDGAFMFAYPVIREYDEHTHEQVDTEWIRVDLEASDKDTRDKMLERLYDEYEWEEFESALFYEYDTDFYNPADHDDDEYIECEWIDTHEVEVRVYPYGRANGLCETYTFSDDEDFKHEVW